MPLVAFDNFGVVCWMAVLGGLAGLVPLRGAARLVSWPLDHDVTFLKMKKRVSLETH